LGRFLAPIQKYFLPHTNRFEATTMRAPIFLAGAMLATVAAPAFAETFWVVQGPDHHCQVTCGEVAQQCPSVTYEPVRRWHSMQ
jgi:hypothetical protein